MVDKNKAEREKGAAPSDYMPAIFGWLNMEDQAEQAREISDISKNTSQNNSGFSTYKFSNLEDSNLSKIQNLEKEINDRRNNDIILIAFNKK